MPWQEVSTMSLRQEFVTLARKEGANKSLLADRFGISRPTGYKWLRRFAAEGTAGLQDRSRQPRHSPQRTAPEIEATVLQVRWEHPAWGGRKIRRWLQNHGHTPTPSPSTVTEVLRRHGQIDEAQAAKHRPWQRFERAAPNELWQMDFKGHFALVHGRCHPLTVIDDHSRFLVGLEACGNEQWTTVQGRLTPIFRRYGLPERMIMDNGAPWGSDLEHPYTPLTVWLWRLGIGVSHGRPYHPQTQGKDERLHRTLKAELLQGRTFHDLAHCQQTFDPWRDGYNLERPHEALGLATPSSRYQPSPRPFPETLSPIEYGPGDHLRKVQLQGALSFHGKTFQVGKAFEGFPVALRETATDGVWAVYFLSHVIASIDERDPVAP